MKDEHSKLCPKSAGYTDCHCSGKLAQVIKKPLTTEISTGCEHLCTSNCRREGCNCDCGEWHEEYSLDFMDSLKEEIICSLYGMPEEWNKVAKEYGPHEADYGVIELRTNKIMEIIRKYV